MGLFARLKIIRSCESIAQLTRFQHLIGGKRCGVKPSRECHNTRPCLENIGCPLGQGRYGASRTNPDAEHNPYGKDKKSCQNTAIGKRHALDDQPP